MMQFITNAYDDLNAPEILINGIASMEETAPGVRRLSF